MKRMQGKVSLDVYGLQRLRIQVLKQGSKKTPSGRPGQVDFPFGQVTFSPSLPDGQGPRQGVQRLNF